MKYAVRRAAFQTLPGLLTGFFQRRDEGTNRWHDRFQTLPGLLTGFFRANAAPACWICSFKPFQGFLPVSSFESHNCHPLSSTFQTLPGLLTGFFYNFLIAPQSVKSNVSNPSRASYRFLLDIDIDIDPPCFKPFQGFLPVSSECCGKDAFRFLRFKPFQGFLPVSSIPFATPDFSIS